MTDSIGTFAGIGSGFDYRSLVDAIIKAERQPGVAIQSRIDTANSRLQALATYRGLVDALEASAKALRNGTAFDAVSTTVANATSPTGRTVLSAAAAAGAAPGSYAVQVLQTAQAEKLSGAAMSSTTAALGYAGDFVLNGKTISVVASDTLASIRDKINSANAGSTPTGVSAAIVADSTTSQRLILTSQNTGAAGIDLRDGAQGLARQLGWIDASETIKRPTSAGAESERFASSSATIASQLGLVSAPGVQTVTVAGQAVTIDLATDSLDSIATKLSALTGIQATVQSTTVSGATKYYLDIRNTTSFVDSGNALAQLGVLVAGRSPIAQQLQGAPLTAGDATTPATVSTLLTSLWNGGSASGARAGDTLSISGTRGDGSSVTATFTIGAGSTVQDLLNTLNDATSGFGAGSRPATASIDASGRIVLTDGTAGQSALSLRVVANNEGGGRLDLGSFDVASAGRARQLVSGADARFSVDGVTFTRSANTVTDVIAGTTLTLTAADPSLTASVTVERSTQLAQQAVQGYVDAYNKLAGYIRQQQTAGTNGAPNPVLYNDSTLRLARSSLASTMLTTVVGAPADLATAAMTGLSLTREGNLTLDAAKFSQAFTTRYQDVRGLFMEQGTSANPEIVFGAATSATRPGTYDVTITQAAARATLTGTGFSGTYSDDATPDVMTITDTATGAAVGVQLSAGMTTGEIVDALNAEFRTAEARVLETGATLYDATGTTAASASTLFVDLRSSAASSSGVVAGDSIAYGGIRPDGTPYNGSFVVGPGSTVSELVAQIQRDLGSGASVSFANGKLTVRATATGSSPLSLSLTPGNEGGGALDFGGMTTVAAGHSVLSLSAANAGGQIQLTSDAYGAAAGFNIAFTGGGTNSTAQLGLPAGSSAGRDVQGSIGGFAATGSGRTLTGGAGTPAAGLSLSYMGATVGAVGTLTLEEGVGAIMDRLLSSWRDPGGTLDGRTQQLNAQITDQQRRLDNLNARLELRRQALLKQYLAMDTAVQKLQAQGSAFRAALAGNGGTTSLF